MMRGQAPKYFFIEPPLAIYNLTNVLQIRNRWALLHISAADSSFSLTRWQHMIYKFRQRLHFYWSFRRIAKTGNLWRGRATNHRNFLFVAKFFFSKIFLRKNIDGREFSLPNAGNAEYRPIWVHFEKTVKRPNDIDDNVYKCCHHGKSLREFTRFTRVNFRLFFYTCNTRLQSESPWYFLILI